MCIISTPMYMIQLQLSKLVNWRLFCTSYATSQLPSVYRQYSRRSSFPGKMSSGRGSRISRESGNRRETVEVDRRSSDVSASCNNGYSHIRGKILTRKMVGIGVERPKTWAASHSLYEMEYPPLSASIGSSTKAKRRTKIDLQTDTRQRLKEKPEDVNSSQFEASPMPYLRSKEENFCLTTIFGKKRFPPSIKRHKLRKSHHEYSVDDGKTDSANKVLPLLEPFDFCFSKIGQSYMLDASLNAKNKEKQGEMEHSMESYGQVLRPGMVLLRNYMTLNEQVQIVKICRELGLGPGGFYQPGYRDGAKLRLRMMCLGLDWDPQTKKYGKRRAFDDSEPPAIPREFDLLVKRAIQDSHVLIESSEGVSNVGDILPHMSPDICIVNFYMANGRLGLHQDRDESEVSLQKGLPVVSFSIGDSAEFLYGEKRNVENAEKVVLESGDVLIFGGDSRHIFHGVPSIIPNSSPLALLEETKLRPGRLNLTFRQY